MNEYMSTSYQIAVINWKAKQLNLSYGDFVNTMDSNLLPVYAEEYRKAKELEREKLYMESLERHKQMKSSSY